mmetsp:Transcript_5092/g.12344  ORF Transcript_5092/g.12344 Transcript_5092/m.12344 type:complete len:262 (+) Transcript_5092:891-1676(+)
MAMEYETLVPTLPTLPALPTEDARSRRKLFPSAKSPLQSSAWVGGAAVAFGSAAASQSWMFIAMEAFPISSPAEPPWLRTQVFNRLISSSVPCSGSLRSATGTGGGALEGGGGLRPFGLLRDDDEHTRLISIPSAASARCRRHPPGSESQSQPEGDDGVRLWRLSSGEMSRENDTRRPPPPPPPFFAALVAGSGPSLSVLLLFFFSSTASSSSSSSSSSSGRLSCISLSLSPSRPPSRWRGPGGPSRSMNVEDRRTPVALV